MGLDARLKKLECAAPQAPRSIDEFCLDDMMALSGILARLADGPLPLATLKSDVKQRWISPGTYANALRLLVNSRDVRVAKGTATLVNPRLAEMGRNVARAIKRLASLTASPDAAPSPRDPDDRR